MKKILYTLLMASLFAVSCTKEVGVSKKHDIDAEVSDLTTKLEMSVLYLNLNDLAYGASLDITSIMSYVDLKEADVVTFVAPTRINGERFSDLLTLHAETRNLQVLYVENVDGRLCMAALLPVDYEVERYAVEQGLTFSNAVLHFKSKGIHFVVTDLLESRNEIPSDWEDQIQAMTDAKKTAPIVYNPDNLAARLIEVEALIDRTLEYTDDKGVRPFEKDRNWLWCIDMNTPSNIDMKYGKVFARKDCYDYDDYTEAFFTTETDYFSVSEELAASDPFFALNDTMVKIGGLVDCIAVNHSVYTPSSFASDYTKERNNFLYASDGCWNMFEQLTLDKNANANGLCVSHYPIMVTLKSEE